MQNLPTEIPLPAEPAPAWLIAMRNAFLAMLFSLGLKIKTIENYARPIDWLCIESGHRGFTAPDGVDEVMFRQIRDPLPTRLSDRTRQRWISNQDRFIGYLVKEGAIAATPKPSESVNAILATSWPCDLAVQRLATSISSPAPISSPG